MYTKPISVSQSLILVMVYQSHLTVTGCYQLSTKYWILTNICIGHMAIQNIGIYEYIGFGKNPNSQMIGYDLFILIFLSLFYT